MAVAYFFLKKRKSTDMPVEGENMLLMETHVSDIRIHKELDNHRVVVRGIFGVCDKPTANGRIYPRHIMEREIAKLQKKIESGMLYGELDHPETPKVELPRISHRITKLMIDERGYIIGEAIVLNVPAGNIIKEILQTGGKVGVSSRGIGTVDKIEEGKYVVNENYQLITFDFVSNPAVEDAVISEYDFAKINEALDSYQSGSVVVESETDDKIQKVLSEAESVSQVKDERVKEVFEYLGFKESFDKFSELINANLDKIENTFKNISKENDTIAAGLLAIISETRNISNKLITENTKLRRLNNRLQRTNRQLQRENQSLREQYEKVLEDVKEFESLKDEVVRLKHLLDEKEQEIRSKFEEFQLLLREKQEQIDELLLENRSLRERIKNIEIERDSLVEDSKDFVRWFIQTIAETVEVANVNDLLNSIVSETVDYKKLSLFIDRAVLPRLNLAITESKNTAEEGRILMENMLNEVRSIRDEILSAIKSLSSQSGTTTTVGGVPKGKSRLDYLKSLNSSLPDYLSEEDTAANSSVVNNLGRNKLNFYDNIPDGLTPEEYEIIKRLAGIKKNKK